MSEQRRILVTSALPYGNGSIHLGHLVEYLQTDIFVRALKSMGHDTVYVCGDDQHGTPIELNARKRGIPPEQMVAMFQAEHLQDFTRFGISFDGYYGTHSDTNRAYAEEFFSKLKNGGLLEQRELSQLFCNKDQRFLPDRYVRGTCPKCGTEEQYGDVCEKCGTTYAPTDLKQPKCALCGEPPLLKQTQHLFFKLESCRRPLVAWLDHPGRLQSEIRNFVGGWLEQGLQDWCITRDGPYFGFAVPGMENKFFYVWLDAPIGYIGATHRAAEHLGRTLSYVDEVWRHQGGSGSPPEIIHIIGKDIVYFHALFWPAMLHSAGFALPSRLHVHGMLRVNGEKMSKSRGTFINAKTFAAHADPQYLRYYFASKLTAKPEDIDLAFEDFVNRVNAELINKVVNLYSRLVPFVGARFGKKLAATIPASFASDTARIKTLLNEAKAAFERIDHAAAVAAMLEIADIGNKAFQDHKPWELIKSDPAAAQGVCTFVANVCKAVSIVLRPILPELAAKTEKMLGIGPVDFRSSVFDLVACELGENERLLERLEKSAIDKIVEASVVSEAIVSEAVVSEAVVSKPVESEPSAPSASATGAASAPAAAAAVVLEPKAEITYDQFAATELRAAKIVSAERVPKSDKLLKLKVDVGEAEPRQVIAGIGLRYQPEELVGKVAVCVCNLKPAKLMGHESRGMMLAAGPGGKDLSLVELPAATPPGSAVK